MGVQIDLIVPPLIVGLLIIVIFRLNAFIMETSVDNQLNNDMQTFAELTTTLLQEEVKMATDITRPGYSAFPDTVLEFTIDRPGLLNDETVWIQRSEKNLEVIRTNSSTGSSDTLIYPSSLSLLEFKLERKPTDDPTKPPHYLNVKIQTESNPDHHASMRDLDKTVLGFSENEIYLRNIHRCSVIGC